MILLRREEREAARAGRISREELRRLVWRRAAVLGLGVVAGYVVLWVISRVV